MPSETEGYNVTHLDPATTFERHVFHRDQFAHYLRWSFVLRRMSRGERVVDFGCSIGSLAEVLYRNRYEPAAYFGFDVRKQTVAKTAEKFKACPWAHFYALDLVKADPKSIADLKMNADHCCSFEVVEHVGKQNVPRYLENFLACGHSSSKYYLSTPNYDPAVGAAGNHTYDSGDGRGVQPQEFLHDELRGILEQYFVVEEKFGTFASVRDYKPLMNEHQRWVYDKLYPYYDSNMLSVIMAPMFPAHSRNTVWVMRAK